MERRKFCKISTLAGITPIIDPSEFINRFFLQDSDIILEKYPELYNTLLLYSNMNNDFNNGDLINVKDKIAALSYSAYIRNEVKSTDEVEKENELLSSFLQKKTSSLDNKKIFKGAFHATQMLISGYYSDGTTIDFNRLNQNLALSAKIIGSFLAFSNPVTSSIAAAGLAMSLTGEVMSNIPDDPKLSNVKIPSLFDLVPRELYLFYTVMSITARNAYSNSDNNVSGDNYSDLSVSNSKTTSQLVNSLPDQTKSKLKPSIEKLKKEGSSVSNETLIQLEDVINKKIDSAIINIVEHYRAIVKNELEVAEERRIEAKRLDGEIRGAIYIAGQIVEAFGLGKEAELLVGLANHTYQGYLMMAAFSAGTLGPIGLAAGIISIGSGILGLFKKRKSNKKGLANALRNISKQISTMRQEMHERFDYIEIGHKTILLNLEQILLNNTFSTNEIEQSLNDIENTLKNYISLEVADDIATIHNDFSLKSTFVDAFYSDKLSTGQIDRSEIVKITSYFFNHATVTSKRPVLSPYTFSSWDDVVSKNILNRINIDQTIPCLSLLFNSISDGNRESVLQFNPVEWFTGYSRLLETLVLFPEIRNNSIQKQVKQGYEVGVQMNDLINNVFKKSFINNLIEKYEQEKQKIRNLLADSVTSTIESINKNSIIFPNQIKNTFSIGKKTKKLHVNVVFPSYSFLEKELPKERYYFGVFFKHYGYDPVHLAQRLGIIELIPTNNGNLYTRQDLTWKQQYKNYKVKFLKGNLSGKTFGNEKEGWHESYVTHVNSIDRIDNIRYITSKSNIKYGGINLDTTSKFLNFLNTEIHNFHRKALQDFRAKLKLRMANVDLSNFKYSNMMRLIMGWYSWIEGNSLQNANELINSSYFFPSTGDDIYNLLFEIFETSTNNNSITLQKFSHFAPTESGFGYLYNEKRIVGGIKGVMDKLFLEFYENRNQFLLQTLKDEFKSDEYTASLFAINSGMKKYFAFNEIEA